MGENLFELFHSAKRTPSESRPLILACDHPPPIRRAESANANAGPADALQTRPGPR